MTKSTISLIISILSVIISIITALYNYYCNRFNIKISNKKITTFVDRSGKFVFFTCSIDNRSRHFISINNILLVYDKRKSYSLSNKVQLGSTEGEILGRKYKFEKYSTILPIKLSSYDSVLSTFLFPVNTDNGIKIKKIEILTSRGKKKIRLNKKYNFK